MKPFEPSRLHVEYRDHVSKTSPVWSRKYTMTHSDDTAELYVTIGQNYAKDKIGPLRDEVLLRFGRHEDQLKLLGSVLIDVEGTTSNAEKRNEIFLREMPTALQAIRYADASLYEQHPQLDEIPILIWFQSNNEKYNKLYDFGTMKDYRKE